MKGNHSLHQTDLSLEMQILNISVNLARIANWIYGLKEIRISKGNEIYQSRIELIRKMFVQTESYLKDLNKNSFSSQLKFTFYRFKDDFEILKNKPLKDENALYLYEKALTWANILQHRAKLI